jgi:hypothetical protein
MTGTQMIDLTMVAIVAFAVGVLYVVERMTRGKQLNVIDMIKLSALSGGITGGVLYSINGSSVASVVETAQDMFVGKPSF